MTVIGGGQVAGYRPEGRDLVLLTADGQAWSVPGPVDARVWQALAQAHVAVAPARDAPDTSSTLLWIAVGAGVVVGLVYFLRKSRGGAYGNIFALRGTKARPIETADKARFTDVGGNRQAVELLADLVDFLRAPQRWLAAGLRIPRGILLVGPPGTGKTLLARAVAGETQAAFFYTSAAEFVEMFVGIGAARVRGTFEKAAAQQPAVIFIDELDAIGRRRGSGSGTVHEEREQTLNQLLVMLDGIERHKRLVVMAATNRPDILDPALLRSGRFDRVLRLETPKLAERIEILKIHTRNKPLDARVSLDGIAGQTDGFSGADLESLANGAGLLAVRRTRNDASANGSALAITMDDFARALEDMTKTNRRFDRLDSILVESVSQFAEPTGRAHVRATLSTGAVVEGEVLWMNATHIKLRAAGGAEIVVAKERVAQLEPLAGTESAPVGDVVPDRWAGQNLDTG